MSSARRDYQRAIRAQLGMLAVWPPGAEVRLGDVGELRSGEFVRLTTLSALNIPFAERRGTNAVDFDHSANATITAGARAAVAAVPSPSAAATLDLEGTGSFVFQARECVEHSIEDRKALERAILASIKSGAWKSSWIVVDTIYVAQAAVIIVSNSLKASVDLAASGALLAGGLGLAKASASLHVSSTAGSVTKLLTNDPCVPLIHSSRVRRPYLIFGDPTLRRERALRGPAAPDPQGDPRAEGVLESADAEESPPRHHALLIGVDRYPSLPTADQLHGCVADATAMRDFLIGTLGLDAQSVTMLTSPADGPAGATSPAIRAAMAALAQEGVVGAGDHVLLYYAAHGLRLVSTRADGSAVAYYGLVPSDFNHSTDGFANLILDREIAAFLATLRKRGAQVSVVADTCYSGSSLRGIATLRERYIKATISSEQLRRLEASHPGLAGGGDAVVTRGVRSGPAYGDDFVVLTACQSNQTAKEHTFDTIENGKPSTVQRGVFTSCLLATLRSFPATRLPHMSWSDCYDAIAQSMAALMTELQRSGQGASPQQPALEGDAGQRLFGGVAKAQPAGFAVYADGRALHVAGGVVAGLEPGARIAIYPADCADFDDADAMLPSVAITAATPWTSQAQLPDLATIPDGARARLVGLAASSRLSVRLVDMPEALATRVMKEAGDVVVRTQSEAHLEIQPWPGAIPDAAWNASDGTPRRQYDASGGWALVRSDEQGTPAWPAAPEARPEDVIAYVPARVGSRDIDASEQTDALAAALRAYAIYLASRDRRSADDTLARYVEVRLLSARFPTKVEGRPLTTAEEAAFAPVEPHDGVHTIEENDVVQLQLRIERLPQRLKLFLAVVAFSDDGNVKQLWPAPGQVPTFDLGEELRIGQDRFQALWLGRRGDQRRSRWTLKLFAATAEQENPIDRTAFEQEKTIQDVIACRLERCRGTIGMPAALRQERPAWFVWRTNIAVVEPTRALRTARSLARAITAPTAVARTRDRDAPERFVRVWSTDGGTALLGLTGMAVDGDGSPRCYHPDGTSGLDNLQNAKDGDRWVGVVTDSKGQPIVQTTGPTAGFYISPTSLADRRFPVADIRRYVDAEQIPYFAFPSKLASPDDAHDVPRLELGVNLGDYALLFDTVTGRSCMAIFGDVGPSYKLGEASCKVASLLGLDPSPRHGGTSSPRIVYLIFPRSFVAGPSIPAPDDIVTRGTSLFTAWGGLPRLQSLLPWLKDADSQPTTDRAR